MLDMRRRKLIAMLGGAASENARRLRRDAAILHPELVQTLRHHLEKRVPTQLIDGVVKLLIEHAEAERVSHQLGQGRHSWVQVARGSVELNGQTLREGDGAAISDEQRLDLTGRDSSEVLLFDLA